jgi:hypothetical protein
MIRPSDEKIASWQGDFDGLDHDQSMFPVYCAGEWAGEVLAGRGFDDDDVEHHCHIVGQMCFLGWMNGKDMMDIAEDYLNGLELTGGSS